MYQWYKPVEITVAWVVIPWRLIKPDVVVMTLMEVKILNEEIFGLKIFSQQSVTFKERSECK